MSVQQPEENKNNKTNKKLKRCRIHVPNGQEYICEIPKNALGQHLLTQFFDLLNIIETDYFGLYFHDFSSYNWWLEPNKTVKHQIKSELWEFYFGVKFYPQHPSKMFEDCTKYYLVLQLRNDILSGRLPCTFATHALLGSYVAQSELGDYDITTTTKCSYSQFSFAPHQSVELEDKVKELHQMHKGLTPEEAESHYLQSVSKLSMYGIDLHHSRDSECVDLNIGIGYNGINIYKDASIDQCFYWTQIIKLSYICSKFYITYRTKDSNGERFNKIGFKMANHRSAKKVWKSAVENHSFFRLSHNNMKQPTNKLVRIGSTFRYSGRTQYEAREEIQKRNNHEQPKIIRRMMLHNTENTTVATNNENNSQQQSKQIVATTSQPSNNQQVFEEIQNTVSSNNENDEKPPPLPAKRLKRPTTQQSSSVSNNQQNVVSTSTLLRNNDAVHDGDDDGSGNKNHHDDTIDDHEQFLVAAHSLSTIESDHSTNHQLLRHNHHYDVNSDVEDNGVGLLENDVHLSLHQKQIQKMKIEFLTTLPPNSSDSQCSLEALDARLPPRRISSFNTTPHDSSGTTHDSSCGTSSTSHNKSSANSSTTNTNTKVESYQDVDVYEDNNRDEVKEDEKEIKDEIKPTIITTETKTNEIVTEETNKTDSVDEDEPATTRTAMKPDDNDDVNKQSNVTSQSPPSDEDNKDDTTTTIDVLPVVSTNNNEDIPPPADVCDDIVDDTTATITTNEQVNIPTTNYEMEIPTTNYEMEIPTTNYEMATPTTNMPEVVVDSIVIPTVETVSVEVEDVCFPKGDNQIRRISLRDESNDELLHENQNDLKSQNEQLQNDTNDITTTTTSNDCQAPTVQTTEVVIIENQNDEDKNQIVGSYQAPLVITETTTITYECVDADDHSDITPPSSQSLQENSSSQSSSSKLLTNQINANKNATSTITTTTTMETTKVLTEVDHQEVELETSSNEINQTKVVELETTSTSTNK